MSDFLAEARVIVRPDVTGFRVALEKQLLAATRGVVVPIAVTPVAAGGVKSLAGATSGLAASQAALVQSSAQVAGAQAAVAASTQKSTSALLGAGSATAKLDAALLGLRTALGSTAVIGLGALALAAIVAGKALSASIKNFAAFEQELSTFRVVAGATAEQMQAVREQATRLGEDVRLPAVSAADAAIAMTELAKAGLSVEEAFDGAEGVLQLATAAQISNADAALIAANALNSFGLAGDQATRVADDLANAANAAQGSITDFGLALRQSSAVARQVGLSLEDTTAILSLFAKNGLQGSDAGTSLRVALIRLVAPTAKAAIEIKKLGLDIRDAQGNVRADVFAQFGEATRDLAPATRDAAAALIFGQDAIRAVSIGAREGAAGLRLMQFEIDQQGTAAEVAAARTEGLAGSLSALQSNAQTLSIQLGKLASPILKNLADGFSSLASVMTTSFTAFQRWNQGLRDFTDSLPGGRETNEFIDFFATPGKAFAETAKGINSLINGSDVAGKRISQLNEELQALQDARIAVSQPGSAQLGIGDQLTKQIEALRKEIALLKQEGKGVPASITQPLQDAVVQLEKVRDIRISLGVDTTGIDKLIRSLKESIPVAQETARENERLTRGFTGLGSAAQAGASGVDVLTKALNGLRRESAQAQAELLKLQTEGGTPQEQIAVLQRDIAAQFETIAKQQVQGGAPGAATAIKKAREQIKSDQSEVASLQAGIVSDAKKAADEAERVRNEQDKAVQRQFDAISRPTERLLARAGLTEPLKDDIKFTTQLIELYKRQIAQAAKRIQDVQTRNQVLRVLGDKLFQAILERTRLAREERQRIRDALVERIERLQRGTQLDIELADINENTKRRIALREKLIAQLKNERKKLHLTGNALKENRNEIARINAEIEGIKKETKKTGKSFAELTFEFLQTQQGFAANLLGNLIPGGATGGLVGGAAAQQLTLPQPGAAVQRESAIAAGRDLGFSRGQGDTTNALLRKILASLQHLNGRAGHPEARHQRATQSAFMDVIGT